MLNLKGTPLILSMGYDMIEVPMFWSCRSPAYEAAL